MRLFSAMGPGDIVAAHRLLAENRPVVSGPSINFSGQLTEWCRIRGVEALLVSSHPRADSVTDAGMQLANLPSPARGGGWRYHLGQLRYAETLARMAKRFGADLALIDSGTCQYFALGAFRRRGIPVAVNFHNVRWPQGFPPTGRAGRIVRRLDDRFFRTGAAGAIGCSPACGDQARSGGADRLPFVEWRAQYRDAGFDTRIDDTRAPFRLLFVGRAEEPKGVLDLVAVADRLQAEAEVPVLIDVCGDGTALGTLRARIAAGGLEQRIRVHGHLDRADLLKVYAAAHAVIVPTRGTFTEGLPLVCAEAVLSGRPIVTSRLSNALSVLGPAIEEARPEDIGSYVTAIRALAEQPARYAERRAACAPLATQFLDRARSYPAALDRLLGILTPGWAPLADYRPVFERL